MGLAAGQLEHLRPADPIAAGRLLAAADAALEAVAPARLVRRALAVGGGGIRAGGVFVPGERAAVLAFGKAAVGMSRGADQALGPLISRGLTVSHEAGGDHPGWAEPMTAGHPLPDWRSVRAGRAALALAESVEPDEVLLCLASGGGSALLEAPAEGLELDDIRDLNARLIRSGAPIEAINRVRREASQVKGGRLAARCRGRTVTLVISDAGRDPAAVASGPTVAPPTAGESVGELLNRFGVAGRAAEQIRRLEQAPPPDRSPAAETPPGPALILADCFTAGGAAVRSLSKAGLEAELDPDPLCGPVSEAVRRALASTPEGSARVLVGETTVEVTGSGQGGRNQHAALTAALEIAGAPHRFLAFGTDGIDGPTDAAGGLVDGGAAVRPGPALRRLEAFDSYPYLEAAGGLLRTGSTGTNVADLWIVDKTG